MTDTRAPFWYNECRTWSTTTPAKPTLSLNYDRFCE
nr:MAG TPA: hypothetical protein [Inoviridae sp.]